MAWRNDFFRVIWFNIMLIYTFIKGKLFNWFHENPAPFYLNPNYNYGICVFLMLSSMCIFFLLNKFFIIDFIWLNHAFILDYINRVLFKVLIIIPLLLYVLNIFEFYLKSLLFSLAPIIRRFLNYISSNRLLNLLKNIVFYLIMCLLAFRSLFLRERPIYIYFLGVVIILNIYFKIVSIETSIIFLLLQGLYFLSFDLYSEIISDILLNYPDCEFALAYSTFVMRKQQSPFIIIRQVGTRSAAGIFFGKSGLTPTGKGSVVVGAMTGGALLWNGHLQRNHEWRLQEHQRNHEWQLQEHQHLHEEGLAEKQRAHEKERWEHESKMKNSSWWSKGK